MPPDTIATPPAPAAAAPTDTTKLPAGTPDPKAAAPATGGDLKGTVNTPDGKLDVTKEANPDDPTKPYAVTVEGKEVHMSRADLERMIEKGRGADKKFQEAAKIRDEGKRSKEQAAQFFAMLRDPASARQVLANPKLGLPFRQIAEEYLAEIYKIELMDPKDRELHETKKKLEEVEAEKKKAFDDAAKKQMDELKAHYDNEHEKDIMAAIDSSGLPKSQWTVQQIARYMYLGLQRGVPLKALDVVDIVRNEYHRAMTHMWGSLDGDKLLDLMGDDTIKKVNSALMKRVNGNGTQTPPPPANNGTGDDSKPKKFSKQQWRDNLDKKTGRI